MISVSEISHSRRFSWETKKGKYINEVYPNISQLYDRASHAESSIYSRDINSSPKNLQNWNYVLIVVEIPEI